MNMLFKEWRPKYKSPYAFILAHFPRCKWTHRNWTDRNIYSFNLNYCLPFIWVVWRLYPVCSGIPPVQEACACSSQQETSTCTPTRAPPTPSSTSRAADALLSGARWWRTTTMTTTTTTTTRTTRVRSATRRTTMAAFRCRLLTSTRPSSNR